MLVSNHPRTRPRSSAAHQTARACCRTTVPASATSSRAMPSGATSRWPRSRTGRRAWARATLLLVLRQPQQVLALDRADVAEVFKEYYQDARQRRGMSRPCIAGCRTRSPGRRPTSCCARWRRRWSWRRCTAGRRSSTSTTRTRRDRPSQWPGAGQTLDALDGVDKTIASLERASRARRPGRTTSSSSPITARASGSTFLQRSGKTLQDVVGELIGGADAVRTPRPRASRTGASSTPSCPRSRQVKGATGRDHPRDDRWPDEGRRGHRGARRAHGRRRRGRTGRRPNSSSARPAISPSSTSRAWPAGSSLETLEATYPEMVDALASHPGIGAADGPVRDAGHDRRRAARPARPRDGWRWTGEDPVDRTATTQRSASAAWTAMAHCGDLVAIGRRDARHRGGRRLRGADRVARWPGRAADEADIMHPAAWTIDEPIVGAEAVSRQIRHWLSDLGIELGPQAEAAAATGAGTRSSGAGASGRRARQAPAPQSRPARPPRSTDRRADAMTDQPSIGDRLAALGSRVAAGLTQSGPPSPGRCAAIVGTSSARTGSAA